MLLKVKITWQGPLDYH